jgi:nitrogen fixation protein NifX
MKVAFATTDGGMINEHFGRAGMFAIYDITLQGHQFIELRKFADGMDRSVTDTKDLGPLHDSAVESKVARLSDCKLVYLTEIGGPSAARLVKKGILPMKIKEPIRIDQALGQLLDMIRNSPPPWIRKAIGGNSE